LVRLTVSLNFSCSPRANSSEMVGSRAVRWRFDRVSALAGSSSRKSGLKPILAAARTIYQRDEVN
jgi:hypothetical protein